MNDEIKAQCEKALNKAKFTLMAKKDSVFFTSLCFSLRHVFSENVSTAATNNKYIYYNPEFFLKMTDEERVFVMLHETMHCAYLHLFRAKQLGLNHQKYNVAADHVINIQLIDRGFKMPEGGLADFQYRNLDTEEVYKLLPPDLPPPPMSDLLDPSEGSEGAGPDDIAAVQRQMEEALVRAAIQSKKAGDKPGTIPGDIEIAIDKLLNPTLPWQTILRRYLKSFSKAKYNWKKPNRRLLESIYLPARHSQSLIDLAIAVDTSGSISDRESSQFVSEITSIFKMMKPKNIKLIQFDTSIKSEDKLKNLQDISKVTFTGRGGTRISSVMEWASKNKPQLLLVFTDGEFHFPTHTDKQPETLWLIHNNPNWKAPYGKVIHYTMNKS